MLSWNPFKTECIRKILYFELPFSCHVWYDGILPGPFFFLLCYCFIEISNSSYFIVTLGRWAWIPDIQGKMVSFLCVYPRSLKQRISSLPQKQEGVWQAGNWLCGESCPQGHRCKPCAKTTEVEPKTKVTSKADWPPLYPLPKAPW